jgi:hypothetical protein
VHCAVGDWEKDQFLFVGFDKKRPAYQYLVIGMNDLGRTLGAGAATSTLGGLQTDFDYRGGQYGRAGALPSGYGASFPQGEVVQE